MILESKRLCLRPWRLSDAERLYEMAKDSEIGPAAGWPPHRSVEESREILETVLMNDVTFAVTLIGEDAPIGCIGWKETNVHEDIHELELGYWMGRDHWGHGYMPEAATVLIEHAFTVQDQNRVWCAHYAENDKSRRVIEKCGFTFVLRREELVELLDEWRVCWYYALTRDEFEEKTHGKDE